MSDTIPILSDSCRSEATLFVTYKRVSDRSQDFAISFAFIRRPFQGRRFDHPSEGVVAPSLFGRAVSGGNQLPNSSSGFRNHRFGPATTKQRGQGGHQMHEQRQ
jgi:hypothetical protein